MSVMILKTVKGYDKYFLVFELPIFFNFFFEELQVPLKGLN